MNTEKNTEDLQPVVEMKRQEIDPVAAMHQELDNYAGPRGEHELDAVLQKIENEYSIQNVPDALFSEKTNAVLMAKKLEEMAAVRTAFLNYNQLYRSAIQQDLAKKKQELEIWASANGVPPQDFLTGMAESSEKPWETAEIGMIIDKKHYSKILQWLQQSPNTQVDFSWGGRMAAYDKTPDGDYKRYAGFRDFAFYERNTEGQRVVRTHHALFKEFALTRGVVIPDGQEVQQKLQTVNPEHYQQALAILDQKMEHADETQERRLAHLKGKVDAYLIFMNNGVEEPKEKYNIDKGERLADVQTNYNDLIYNADDYFSERDWEDVGIPEKDRLQFVDGDKMEKLCQEFGKHLLKQGIYQ